MQRNWYNIQKNRHPRQIFYFMCIYIAIIVLVLIIPFFSMAQDTTLTSTVSTTGQIQTSKIQPGNTLPVQVQLINFGTPDERVDVTLHYTVRNSFNEIVLEKSETVAVETTASFVRNILIPETFTRGTYTLHLDALYRDQVFPAISQTQFIIGGNLFSKNQTYHWYTALPLLFLIFTLFVVFSKKRVVHHSRPNRDYSMVPAEQRTYYEIVHDIVDSLHYHIGDRGIKNITQNIAGLSLDPSLRHVESIHGPVEVIIAQLIQAYEKTVGKKANIITQPSYTKKRIQTH